MKKFKYRNKCWLSFSTVQKAIDENWYSSLAYLVLIKGIHENNTFYNFSVRKTAKLIKVSHSALNNHLKVLSQQGLIRFNGDNMTINSSKKIAKSSKSFLVPIATEKKFKTIKNLKIAIRSVLIVK